MWSNSRSIAPKSTPMCDLFFCFCANSLNLETLLTTCVPEQSRGPTHQDDSIVMTDTRPPLFCRISFTSSHYSTLIQTKVLFLPKKKIMVFQFWSNLPNYCSTDTRSISPILFQSVLMLPVVHHAVFGAYTCIAENIHGKLEKVTTNKI